MAKKYLIVILKNEISVYTQMKGKISLQKSGEKFTINNIVYFWEWWRNAIDDHSQNKKADLYILSDEAELLCDVPFQPLESSFWNINDLREFVNNYLGYNLVMDIGDSPNLRKPNLYINYPTRCGVMEQNQYNLTHISDSEKSDMKKFFENLLVEFKND